MGATSIQWCDFTLNPILGCSKVSEACRDCYAEVSTPVRVHRSRGVELWGDAGARHETKGWEAQARRWNRAAEKEGRRARVFCASLSDVFEDRAEWVPVRARLARLVAETPHLDWLLLTKRPENAHRLWAAACPFADAQADARAQAEEDDDDLDLDPGACVCGDHACCAEGWIPNVWLGTTVENQARADERIPHLLAVPAAVRFLSCEPLLERVDLSRWLPATSGNCGHCGGIDGGHDRAHHGYDADGHGVDWCIIGGESGSRARPFNIAWARDLVSQCRAAGVAPFVKQLGANPRVKHEIGDASEWPEDLRVREFPKVPS